MALKGTLKDFGIADILQLIGHQSKSGTLRLQEKGEEVEVHFVNGNVVRASPRRRKKEDLLGAMLQRSGLISTEQLEEAIDVHRKSLKRLGDVMVQKGFVSEDRLKKMALLQTTETLYRLFTWKQGTYEFIPGEVEAEPTDVALRAESILMEGVRVIDEWPMVRQRITSDRSTFEVVKPLPVPPLAAGASDVDSALDEAIAGAAGDGERDKNTRIGRNERITFGVIEPGRSVRDLADRSMLGEFETSKALYNLVEQGYLKPVAPPRVSLVAKAGPSIAGVAAAWAVRFALYGAIGAGAYFAAVKLLPHPVHASEPRPLVHAESRRLLARAQAARLSQALETFRVEKGAYPESLKELVEAKLVAENDLSFPWREPYFYRKTERGFVLLPPLD